jgi:hypothetical protein
MTLHAHPYYELNTLEFSISSHSNVPRGAVILSNKYYIFVGGWMPNSQSMSLGCTIGFYQGLGEGK